MQTLRLRGLTPGQEYIFPVRIRKVLEIKDKHNLFTSPAHYWVNKKVENIPTTQILRVEKTPIRYTGRYGTDIVPISRREVRPLDLAEVSRVVETIVREHSIPQNAYVVIDYGVETSLGRFVLNLWWFPQNTKIFMKYNPEVFTLEDLNRMAPSAFYTASYIIPGVIGHKNIKQVYGPRLGFEWERDRTQEIRDQMRVRTPRGMVLHSERNRQENVNNNNTNNNTGLAAMDINNNNNNNNNNKRPYNQRGGKPLYSKRKYVRKSRKVHRKKHRKTLRARA